MEEKALKIINGEGSGEDDSSLSSDPNHEFDDDGSDMSQTDNELQGGSDITAEQATVECLMKEGSRSTTLRSVGSPEQVMSSMVMSAASTSNAPHTPPAPESVSLPDSEPAPTLSPLTSPPTASAIPKRPLEPSTHNEEGTPKRVKLKLKQEAMVE